MAVPYVFADIPNGNAIPLSYLDANFAAVGSSNPIQMESLFILTPNVLPSLSKPYSGNMFLLIVNGYTFAPVGSPAPFTVSGITVTWTSTVFGINPGDSVVAVYSYTA